MQAKHEDHDQHTVCTPTTLTIIRRAGMCIQIKKLITYLKSSLLVVVLSVYQFFRRNLKIKFSLWTILNVLVPFNVRFLATEKDKHHQQKLCQQSALLLNRMTFQAFCSSFQGRRLLSQCDVPREGMAWLEQRNWKLQSPPKFSLDPSHLEVQLPGSLSPCILRAYHPALV